MQQRRHPAFWEQLQTGHRCLLKKRHNTSRSAHCAVKSRYYGALPAFRCTVYIQSHWDSLGKDFFGLLGCLAVLTVSYIFPPQHGNSSFASYCTNNEVTGFQACFFFFFSGSIRANIMPLSLELSISYL